MTLKRFCDICKQEAKGGFAYLGTSNTPNVNVIDLCKNCEKYVLAALSRITK